MKCELCGHDGIYSGEYDATYCPECDVWLEVYCKDHSCHDCEGRPLFPSGDMV